MISIVDTAPVNTGAAGQFDRDVAKRQAVRSQYRDTPRVKVAGRQHFRRQERLAAARDAKAAAALAHVAMLEAHRARSPSCSIARETV